MVCVGSPSWPFGSGDRGARNAVSVSLPALVCWYLNGMCGFALLAIWVWLPWSAECLQCIPARPGLLVSEWYVRFRPARHLGLVTMERVGLLTSRLGLLAV
jgi:hypothetical protein